MIHFQSRSIPQILSPVGERGPEGDAQMGFAAAFHLSGQGSLEGLAALSKAQRGLTVDPLGRRMAETDQEDLGGGLGVIPIMGQPQRAPGDETLPNAMDIGETGAAQGSVMLPPLLQPGASAHGNGTSGTSAPDATTLPGPDRSARDLARSARTLLAVPRVAQGKAPKTQAVPVGGGVATSAASQPKQAGVDTGAPSALDRFAANPLESETNARPSIDLSGLSQAPVASTGGKATAAQVVPVTEIPVTGFASALAPSPADEVLEQMIQSFKPRTAAATADPTGALQHRRPASAQPPVPVVQSVDAADPLAVNAWRWEAPRVGGSGSPSDASGAARLVSQLAQPIQAIVAGRITQRSVTVHLNPPDLGRVDIGVLSSHGGRVEVTIRVERGETERVLQQHLPQLRASLEQQGIDLQSLALNPDGDQASGKESPLDQDFFGTGEQRQASEQETASASPSGLEPTTESGRLGGRLSLVI